MYQFLLEKIILPIGDLFNRSSYIPQLRHWRKIDQLSEEEIEALQQKNLNALLKHAVENVPYYSEVVASKKDQKLSLDDFPILEKDIIRNRRDQLIAKGFNVKNLIPYASSGSSGAQTTVYMTKQEQSILRGILTHWWEWSGYRIGKPIIQTGMATKRSKLKLLKDFLFRTHYVYAFSFTDDELKAICDKMQQKTNHYFLAGYASSLNVIAEYALQNNYSIQLRGVISLGDKLFDQYRKNVKAAFQTQVLDTYGSNEGFMIATQNDTPYYYMLSPHVFVEIVDDKNNPVADGEMGHIIVTRLDAYAMPLIRYRIGDLGIKLPKDKYPTNRKYRYPLLEKVVGRETDVVQLPDQRKLIVHSFTGIFEYIAEIKQFKVIQENLEGITIEYIEGNGFTTAALDKAEKELKSKIKDNQFAIEFVRVDYIAPSKSGKPQIVESRLKNE
jgi:phenylacetate-CoA ligase